MNDTAALQKLRTACDRRNRALLRVLKAEDAVYRARQALEVAERKVEEAHRNTDALIRMGDEYEVI